MVTAAGAVVDALNELKAKKIEVCMPYPEDLNERQRCFYTKAGFDIVSFEYAGDKVPHCSAVAARDEALRLALSVDRPEAEAIFMSCTPFEGASGVINLVEGLTGKPVITSNQATFWGCLRALGVDESIDGAGRLLCEHVAV